MALFRRDRQPADRITSENLADFGRYEFLKEQSGIDPSGAYNLISPLNELIFTQNPADRIPLIAELHRHAANGEWEKVGAWKYTREFMDPVTPETQVFIDEGLRAIQRMQVTNLSIHLSMNDSTSWRDLFGTEPPNDGFFGPPVFNSTYGPTRKYYFDSAIATAAARTPKRVPSARGVEPGDTTEAGKAMWNFGMLVHRGPLVVPPDITFEPNVIRPAVDVATNVDHDMFAERVVAQVLDNSAYLHGIWSTLGAARFIEEFLEPSTISNPVYTQVLDDGLNLLLNERMLDVSFPKETLTPRTYERYLQLQAART